MEFSKDNQKIQIATLAFIAGAIVAFIFYPKPEAEEVYKTRTKVETDTIYSRSIDTVFINQTKIKTEVLRDTVLIDSKPNIKAFSTTTAFEYGNTYVNGEVLGEVLKMSVTNDFKIPVVTNTVTVDKVSTVVIKPKGIYLGVNVNSLLQPGAKVAYLDNKYIFEYQYQPLQRIHQIGVSKKLF
jgi:hypothetical protein